MKSSPSETGYISEITTFSGNYQVNFATIFSLKIVNTHLKYTTWFTIQWLHRKHSKQGKYHFHSLFELKAIIIIPL